MMMRLAIDGERRDQIQAFVLWEGVVAGRKSDVTTSEALVEEVVAALADLTALHGI